MSLWHSWIKPRLVLCLVFSAAAPSLRADVPPAAWKFEVRPTVLFVEEGGVLKQRLDVILENPGAEAPGELQIEFSPKPQKIPLARIAAGKSTVSIYIPEIKKSAKVGFVLKAGTSGVSRTVSLSPQRKWILYLLPHSHTDIGYTDLQTRVLKNHLEYLDSVIEFCRATDSYPDEAKFRWNIEVSWALQNYIKSRPLDKVQELFELIRSGRIELSALYLQLSDGFAHEELIRAVTYARELSRANGFTLQAAMNNDVTGFSWALPQIFSQIGVRYFTTGINEDRSRAPLRRPNPFYWQSVDGSRILHWNGEHYLFANYDLLIHEGLEKSRPKVAAYLDKLQGRGDYPYDLIAFHISGYVTDNCPPKKEISDRVREWNARWAYPKLRLATMSEFFTAFEKKYAKTIPAYKLGWPDYWTDGIASTSFETGLNRLAHNDLLTAEKFAVSASLTDASYLLPRGELAEAYESTMLYDEHTWGAWNSISDPDSEFARSQWTVKSGFAYNAREIAKTVLGRGLQALSKNIPSADSHSFAVFNPLSWERTDVVRAALPQDLQSKNGKFKLFDKRTGFEIGYQQPDKASILFLADKVPSLGYAVYSIVPDMAPLTGVPQAKMGERSLENRFYKVAVDPVTGGLASVLDKETGRELVDSGRGPGLARGSIPAVLVRGFKATGEWRAEGSSLDSKTRHMLNQYIYENPEGGRNAVNNMTTPAKFNRISPTAATAGPGMSGPIATSLVVKTKAKPCPEIQQEIVLYDDIRRIDIVNRLKKDETTESEALYFAFPFAVDAGNIRFEIADGTMAPETEQLPGTTRDWHTVQHWVEFASPKLSVVWSPVEAPLVQFGNINTGKWLTKLPLTNTSVFSYAMNNYWHTNFKAAQGGAFVFRYSFTTRAGGSDPLKSTRFGWEVHSPLVASWLPAKNPGTLSGTAASFFSVDKPNVIIQAVKPAEDGTGIVLRLREVAGIEAQVKIISSLFRSETVTYSATDVGEGPGNANTVVPASIYVTVKPWAIQTVKIKER